MNGKGFLLDTNAIIQHSIIAATARANNLTVLTADEHFKRLTLPWKVRLFAAMV